MPMPLNGFDRPASIAPSALIGAIHGARDLRLMPLSELDLALAGLAVGVILGMIWARFGQ
jgi:hypothetical protein